jgi:hypothetical protein
MAVWALGEVAAWSETAVQALEGARDDGEPRIRAAAHRALKRVRGGGLEAQIGRNSTNPLLVLNPRVEYYLVRLQSGSRESRLRAAESLSHLADINAAVIAEVQSLLSAKNPDTREAAAHALG